MKNFEYSEQGSLNVGKIRSGVVFEGTFFEFGSIEYKNLMLIEGRDPKNEDSLLGMISKIVTEDINNVVESN